MVTGMGWVTRWRERLDQFFETPGAVTETVAMDIELVEDTQQQVARWHRLGRVGKMTSAFQATVVATEQDMRHIIVQMLVRITHVAAVQHQRVIQQAAVAVIGVLQLVDEVGQHLDVILVDLRELVDTTGIFTVV